MHRIGVVRPIVIALAITLTAAGAAPAASAARARRASATNRALPAVPPAFVGVDVDGPMIDPSSGLDLASQFNTMVGAGVGSVRVAFNWAAAQPYQSWADVPADQQSQFTHTGAVPTDFAATDQLVGLAAEHGMTVLPTVLYAPGWDAVTNPQGIAFPATPGPFAAYLTALIGRYGPHGSFWSANPQIPRMPIRAWQIWNEENISYYWRQPFASSYVALLRAAHGAIKRADPGAKVVLGSLTNVAWKAIGQIYRVRGARGLFDVAAVNGFTSTPANVILYLRLMRRGMARFHDAKKPLIDTEMSWPSARGHTTPVFDWDTTEAGQARKIAAVLPMLGADRVKLGLSGFYYYTWIGLERNGTQDFNFGGLEGLSPSGSVFAKPALAAFRKGALALEHCRRKSGDARRCVVPAR